MSSRDSRTQLTHNDYWVVNSWGDSPFLPPLRPPRLALVVRPPRLFGALPPPPAPPPPPPQWSPSTLAPTTLAIEEQGAMDVDSADSNSDVVADLAQRVADVLVAQRAESLPDEGWHAGASVGVCAERRTSR